MLGEQRGGGWWTGGWTGAAGPGLKPHTSGRDDAEAARPSVSVIFFISTQTIYKVLT